MQVWTESPGPDVPIPVTVSTEDSPWESVSYTKQHFGDLADLLREERWPHV